MSLMSFSLHGKLFHSLLACTEKALSPKVTLLVIGISNMCFKLLDLSDLLIVLVLFKLLIIPDPVLCTQGCRMVRYLYIDLSFMGSQ